jgi:hypothetical protein
MKIKLVCSGCGAKGEGSCNCGLPYMPEKQRRAAEEIRINPNRTNRTISKIVGVSHQTVSRARSVSVGPKNGPIDTRRIGKNGSYPVTKRKGVRPYTKDNGRNEINNLIGWFTHTIRPKIKERFNRVIKEISMTKDFSEQSRAVLVDSINYLRQDMEKWIEQLDAIDLGKSVKSNVVAMHRK